MLRILIADRHPIVRRALRDLIEEHPGWDLCAEAADDAEALALARVGRSRLRPEATGSGGGTAPRPLTASPCGQQGPRSGTPSLRPTPRSRIGPKAARMNPRQRRP